MPKSRHARPWVLEAERIRSEVAQLQHGNRQLGLQKIAGRDRNAQTLRRALAALEFIERLAKESKFPAASLEEFPVAAVEYISRWYKRDPSGALRAAGNLLRGEWDVRRLGAEEKKSRKDVFSGAGKALETDYRALVAKKLEAILSGKRSVKRLKTNVMYDPIGLPDFAYADSSGRPTLGVLICGPYRDPDIYRRRAFEWIARSHMLLNVFTRVLLVVPDNAARSHFEYWLTNLKIDKDRQRGDLRLVSLDQLEREF